MHSILQGDDGQIGANRCQQQTGHCQIGKLRCACPRQRIQSVRLPPRPIHYVKRRCQAQQHLHGRAIHLLPAAIVYALRRIPHKTAERNHIGKAQADYGCQDLEHIHPLHALHLPSTLILINLFTKVNAKKIPCDKLSHERK